MKAFGNRFIRVTRRVSALLLALIVVLFISSCSDEGLKLCRVGVSSDDSSRALTAVIDPIGSNIYFRTIYKGTGSCYSSNITSDYIKLTSDGILVSQGL